MKCCSNCFKSAEIKYFIESKHELSHCDVCNTDNTPCVDCRELIFLFAPLIDLYEPSENGHPLAIRLASDFPKAIFDGLDEAAVTNLLRAIFADDDELSAKYLDQSVALSCETNPERRNELSQMVSTWESFSEEIKTVNRFHISNVLDLNKLAELLSVIEVQLPAGRILHRARICSESAYPAEEMWNPPSSKARAGRANPAGISYLYLASDMDTAVHEVRANLLDFVCVGDFQLIRPISIVQLNNVEGKDPFALVTTLEGSKALENFMAFKPFLKRLGEELSLPRRLSDTELDYVPTQYLTEFIKSRGYAGIGYGSSQKETGQNYAIFDPSSFKCATVRTVEVIRIEMTHRPYIPLVDDQPAEPPSSA